MNTHRSETMNQENVCAVNMSGLLERVPGAPPHPQGAGDMTSTDSGWIQRNRRICPKRGSFYGPQLYFSLQYLGPELAAPQDCCSA